MDEGGLEENGNSGGSEVGAEELDEEGPEGELPAEHGAGPAEVDEVASVRKSLCGADIGEVVVSTDLGEWVGSKGADSKQQCAEDRGALAGSFNKHDGSAIFFRHIRILWTGF